MPGTRINAATDLARWLESSEEAQDGLTPATFTVDTERILWLAPRGSEHVACAGGAEVLAAGELVFDGSAVVEATNQSTGYCPEPASWTVLAEALDRLAVVHPGRYTAEFTFRRCEYCGELNVVKESWFVCAACDQPLPREWNCA